LPPSLRGWGGVITRLPASAAGFVAEPSLLLEEAVVFRKTTCPHRTCFEGNYAGRERHRARREFSLERKFRGQLCGPRSFGFETKKVFCPTVSRATMWGAPELSEEEGLHHGEDLSSLLRAGRLPISAVPGNPANAYAPVWIAIRPAPPFASYYPMLPGHRRRISRPCCEAG
jgi:hypothetical protein